MNTRAGAPIPHFFKYAPGPGTIMPIVSSFLQNGAPILDNKRFSLSLMTADEFPDTLNIIQL